MSELVEWHNMESYLPRFGPVLLCIGETIPDLADVRVGSWLTPDEAAELGETDNPFGGWMIWNDCADWYVLEPSEPLGWLPLPTTMPKRPVVIDYIERAFPALAHLRREALG